MDKGTILKATVSRVVDGDTLRVFLPGADKDESLRILSLDTEESYAGGSKPVTPWGKKAKERAEAFFKEGDEVIVEFPGNEEVDVCLKKYRGNYGRLLVFIHKGELDYQEMMIKEGFSPYFNKYGNAEFKRLHDKYILAERMAQSGRIGVWDQIEVNGSEIRNYASLGTWWNLRAQIIDNYRANQDDYDNLYNSRLDYDKIKVLAETREKVIIFTALSGIKKITGDCAVIGIGSIQQPFSLFLPGVSSNNGQQIISLLETRYIPKDDAHPLRSYAYINGNLSVYNGRPQIVIESVSQITDNLLMGSRVFIPIS